MASTKLVPAILLLSVLVTPGAAVFDLSWSSVTDFMYSVVGMEQSDARECTSWPPPFCNDLDCPEYTVVECNKDYEVRQYNASAWVGTSLTGVDFSAAQSTMFMRLFRYISGANEPHTKIDMTCPVITRIIPAQGPACENNFTMSFFVSPSEGQPPAPTDVTVSAESKPAMTVYVRSFGGFASKGEWIEEASTLADKLPDDVEYHRDFYFTAGYDAPFKLFNRHNEVWFIGIPSA